MVRIVNLLVTILTVIKIVFTISPQENFVCVDGEVINLENVCDGIKDCKDGSDETMILCYHIICPSNMTRCFYGACIEKELFCNGKSDCVDNSDENNCGKESESCGKNEFKCISGECIKTDKMCNGVADCLDKSDENKILCEDDQCPKGTFHCKHGGCVRNEALCNGYNDCADGSDESDIVCKMKKCARNCDKVRESIKCPSINSARIKVECESMEGSTKGIVPCYKPLPVGTVARYECRPYYKPANKNQQENKEMVCQIDGSWSRRPLECKPECGLTLPEAAPLIVNGRVSTLGKWPWHASLYILEGGTWTYSCGGSLIHERAVLTAGHCVWNKSPKNLKIGLGKYFSDYKIKQDFTEFTDIDKVITQPLYQDLYGNYGSDIAILVLTKTIEYSNFIRPVCMDWDLYDITEHLAENSIGTVVGMGVTEKDTFSLELRETKLPVASETKCIKMQNRDFKKYITFTSFCAGWNNGTSVCNGDSGGGLVFPMTNNKEIWVLQGIVSVSPRRHGTMFCDTKFYTVFTKVGMYIDWIKSEINKIQVEMYPKDNIIDDNAL